MSRPKPSVSTFLLVLAKASQTSRSSTLGDIQLSPGWDQEKVIAFGSLDEKIWAKPGKPKAQIRSTRRGQVSKGLRDRDRSEPLTSTRPAAAKCAINPLTLYWAGLRTPAKNCLFFAWLVANQGNPKQARSQNGELMLGKSRWWFGLVVLVVVPIYPLQEGVQIHFRSTNPNHQVRVGGT